MPARLLYRRLLLQQCVHGGVPSLRLWWTAGHVYHATVGGTAPQSRPVCTGSGTAPCGGQCNGVSSACVYPATSVICGASCNGNCDGAGTCNAHNGVCPNGYACGLGGCKTTCSAPADCQSNFECDGGTCSRVPESNCFDGVDNNGDGLIDCADPTCTPIAECVVDPGVGTLGNVTGGSCAANFGTAIPVYQTMTDGTCDATNCSCYSDVICATQEDLWSTNTTCTGAPTVSVTLPGDGGCVPITFAYYQNSTSQLDATPTSQGCDSYGTSTLSAPTWGTSSNFCPVVSKGHCPTAGNACVPKIATGQTCVELPLGVTTCPAGYTGTSGEWYTGYSLGTCACGCGAPTGVSCPGEQEVSYYTDSECSVQYGYDTGVHNGDCSTALYYGGPLAFNSSKIGSVRAWVGESPNGAGTCSSVQANKTLASQPVGGATICCH